jgi:hypothetical protein
MRLHCRRCQGQRVRLDHENKSDSVFANTGPRWSTWLLEVVPNSKELRGDVIERAANLETLIGATISTVYFGRVVLRFTFDFLADEYCSFALKRRVLLKLIPTLEGVPGFVDKLNRLNTIRNYFAHVGLTVSESPSPDAPNRTPDPRKFERSVDFEALHKEFLEKETTVVAAIIEQYKVLGGVLE